MTTDLEFEPRWVNRRALRATLTRMDGPWHPERWQTLSEIRVCGEAPVIPGWLLVHVMATLVNAGLAMVGDEVCVGNSCPRKSRTYALTDAGRTFLERIRAEPIQSPWSALDAAHVARAVRRLPLP